jgi:6,7-dimethyl-8-ribityllumazine synthase
MIRSLTYVHPTALDKEYAALSKLFDQLGFEKGHGWDEGSSQGAAFIAPSGDFEFFKGKGVTTTGLLVHVTDLENAREIIRNSRLGAVTEIEATAWKSRLFRFTLRDLAVTFWQFDHPQKHRFQTVEGELWVTNARFGIIVSRFNAFITERLLEGALDALHRTGTKDKNIEVVRVPGAFEVPIAAKSLAASKKSNVDAVICLGLLMRGETSNYEHISDEVARGTGQAAQDSGKPVTYGVLTCDTLEQAIDRAGLKSGNKGFEAAIAAVEMVSLQRKLGKPQSKAQRSGAQRSGAKKR